MARNVLIEHRRGTAAAWTSANPTLAAGEPGFETDTGKSKIGDGSTAWSALLYSTDVSRLAPGSGAIGDDFTVRLDGTVGRYTPTPINLAAWEIATDARTLRITTTNLSTTATLLTGTPVNGGLTPAGAHQSIAGTNIPAGTTYSISGATITLSQAATASATVTVFVGTDNNAGGTGPAQQMLDTVANSTGNRSATQAISAVPFLITSPLTITNTAGSELVGSGDRFMMGWDNNTDKALSWEGATTIYNGCASGQPAILVQGSNQGTGWGTAGIKLRRFAIKNLPFNHGIKYDSLGHTMDECLLEDISINGGDKQLWLTDSSGGGNGPWSLRCVRGTFQDQNGQTPNYNVYGDSATTFGVVSRFEDSTFRYSQLGGIFGTGLNGFALYFDRCTFENHAREMINVAGTNGKVVISGGHAEQNFTTAFFNAGTGRYERSNVDTTAAAYIQLGASGANQPIQLHIEDFDANLGDVLASTDGIHMLALVSQWSGRLSIRSTEAGPSGGSTIQQPLVWTDGFSVWGEISGLNPTKSYSGNGADAGGSSTLHRHGVGWNRANDRPSLHLDGVRVFTGTGHPSTWSITVSAGDLGLRKDTPSTPAQQWYMATVAGASAGAAWRALAPPDANLNDADGTLNQTYDYRYANAVGSFTANQARGGRVRLLKSGTLNNLQISVGNAAGNIDVGIYDTGATLSGTRTRLYSKGSIACPASGLSKIGDPGLTVTEGQSLEFYIAPDGNAATFARIAHQAGVLVGVSSSMPAPGLSAGVLAPVFNTSFPLPPTLADSTDGSALPWVGCTVT